MKAGEEIEAKFDMDPATPLPSFDGADESLVVAELPAVKLTASYFDTSGFRLLARGATLRHRKAAGGGENLWTLKLPNPPAGKAAYSRQEISWSGTSVQIPKEALELVTALTLGEPVSEVAVLVSERRRLEISREGGDRLAEIDDDTVTVRKPARAKFRQVEIELTNGQADLLESLARRLRSAGATRGADEPKLVRALAVAGGAVAGGAVAGGAVAGGAIAVRRSDGGKADAISTISDVVSSSISSGLERLVSSDAGVRIDDDPEFVHQARVATRRMRSDLKTFSAILDPRWVERVRGELRWLGTALGDLRDADVLSARLSDYAATSEPADAEGFAELLTFVAHQREGRKASLGRVLASERYVRLLGDLEEDAVAIPFAAEVDGSAPAAQACDVAIEGAWKRVHRRVRKLGPQPTAADLHRVRIASKQLRYAAEASEGVPELRADRLAKAAEEVQTVLGEHQDAVSVQLWARAAADSSTPAAVLVAGQIICRERAIQHESREAWKTAWRQLRKAAKKRPTG